MSMLQAGLVGLPNVGKSTLFNALTKSKKAEVANYPFCTIDPNVGIVTVSDKRLEELSRLSKSAKTIPAAFELVDIAGLVKGASQGEGLGNQFLSHIREVDAILIILRCFGGDEVHHVSGRVDPVADLDILLTELSLADYATVEKHLGKARKGNFLKGKAGCDPSLLEKLLHFLGKGTPIFSLGLKAEELRQIKSLSLLTLKPILLVCNVHETELLLGEKNPWVEKLIAYVKQHPFYEYVILSAQLEADLNVLDPEERKEYLRSLGLEDSGCDKLVQSVFKLLGLRSFFTTGPKETRAWTIRAGDTASKAAGVIHSDFERGFIAAECLYYEDFIQYGSFGKAREAGKIRIEGKDYIVSDGEIIEFRFNV
ncbi:redox-regulated ATPase YchF [Candidatus Methylacidiphilum infernorum]|uniref:Ribosome-binding ATPase YchF n=2 Tax=Candidatus Methylacidiphilum infernorum TaxID=511746 RepID=A0ABX7PTI7_9BACT|nr:redox-regulated ATPase YchF [Candidatus Methylacidiphilum infernorum]QSR85996.1 redox-regulated ATPase YchF [Candidatus Methylacidiphilum infernorum]